jgi:ABC-type nickel/cobalt efflux system permease component RcnA
MAIVLLFIGLIVTIISSFFISFNIYKMLNVKGNKFAGFLSVISFIVSLIGIGIVVLLVWSQLTGGFSRR